MLDLVWAARTHTGNRRTRNEDCVLARTRVFAVADGMGGHAAGDVASQRTIDHLDALADDGPIDRLSAVEAIRAADADLRRFGRVNGVGIGTTVCALVVTGGSASPERLGLLNVGDSRAYRLRGDRLDQLTHDHSVVQELIDSGTIRSSDADRHPERHVITRSLGGDSHLDIDWWALEPELHDRYLLTSDGLTKEVTTAGIHSILGQRMDADRTADQLIEVALANGGRDNVSVVVVDIVFVDQQIRIDASDPLDGDTLPRPTTDDDQALDADTAPTGSSR